MSSNLTYEEVVRTYWDSTQIDQYKAEIITLINTFTSLPPDMPDLEKACVLGHIINVVFNLGIECATMPQWEKKFKSLSRKAEKVWPDGED